MNQDQKHYKPGSPIPMEFNDPGIRKREMTPEEEERIWEYLRQHPEIQRQLLPPSNKLEGPKWMFIVVLVACILGLILFSAGCAFGDSNRELSSVLMASGLGLSIGASTICVIFDKIRREKLYGPGAPLSEASRANVPLVHDEDTNFMERTPPASRIILTGIGFVILLVSVFVLPVVFNSWQFWPMLLGGFGCLGCLMLLFCFAADNRHDGALTWGILAAAFLGVFVPYLLEYLQPGMIRMDTDRMAKRLSGGILMLSPLLFMLVKRLICREHLTAACIYFDRRPPYGRSRRYPHNDFAHFWQYEYDGKIYIHKEYRGVKNDTDLDEAPIRINPNHPHMFYRRSFPLAYQYLVFIGLLILLFALI